jgi:hypothetical protein
MGTLIDLAEYGRRVRAARILARCDSLSQASERVEEATGVKMSGRTLGALERGDQGPTVEQYFAITLAFRPPGGLAFWEPAMVPEVGALVEERIVDGKP